jgi:hypothetical protein
VIEKIIAPLIYTTMLTTDMDADFQRDNERRNIIMLRNRIRSNMLPANWHQNELQKQRTKSFFQQGAISWWLGDTLEPALRYVLFKIQESKPLLTDVLDQEAESKVVALVDTLCGWEIWSTTDKHALAAIRSNTPKDVSEVFKDHTYQRLIKEAMTAAG